MAPTASTDNIQPVVVYINDDRRHHMEKQLEKVGFTALWCKGYTPDDCVSYINHKHPEYPEKDSVFCCMRSHIKALKYFLENSNKDYALIMEDDLLITKTFNERLNNVLEAWGKHHEEIDFVSIGYLPGNYQSKKSDGELYWDLYCKSGSVWGTQAYLVKRSIVEDMVRRLDQPNSYELYQAINAKIKENGGKLYSPKLVRAQSDIVLSVCWRQAFIKPMLVIESPLFNSTISPTDSNSNTRGWNSAFQTCELKVKDFDPCCSIYLR